MIPTGTRPRPRSIGAVRHVVRSPAPSESIACVSLSLFLIHRRALLAEDYLLKNEDWKFDPIPEIVDGHNIADFIDPDIEHMLEMLEQEEEERIRQLENEVDVEVRRYSHR